MYPAIASSPHIGGSNSTARMMRQVVYALLPGMAVYVFFFGWGLLVQAAIAVAVALAGEAAVLRLRRRPLRPYLADGSAAVTALLLALAIPPLAPWWVTALGAFFAIVIAKHLYGGLGHNPFNPAMVGYVVLLISFPRAMTTWLAPAAAVQALGPIDTVRAVFTGALPPGLTLDALTAATPLDAMKTGLALDLTVAEVRASPLFGDFGGKGWEWLGNAFFLGGLWLLYKRVISWHIPLAMLGSLFGVALLFALGDPDGHPSALFHLFSGAAMLGAFFIATDPITAATTPRGRLIYGAGIGLLTYIIRTWGGYPDGVAFAVLLMNAAVPVIDYYSRPRVLGHRKD
jgi:Na+-translocating ferredoxin:NAD+ oxidoreductase subunit D